MLSWGEAHGLELEAIRGASVLTHTEPNASASRLVEFAAYDPMLPTDRSQPPSSGDLTLLCQTPFHRASS
jgi:hypothetical protein